MTRNSPARAGCATRGAVAVRLPHQYRAAASVMARAAVRTSAAVAPRSVVRRQREAECGAVGARFRPRFGPCAAPGWCGRSRAQADTPTALGAPRWNFSNRISGSATARPGPSSTTLTSTWRESSCALRRSDCRGRVLAGVVEQVSSTCSIRRPSTRSSGRDPAARCALVTAQPLLQAMQYRSSSSSSAYSSMRAGSRRFQAAPGRAAW